MKIRLKNILLIDDDEDDNFFHRLVLEESGITDNIHVVQNSSEALELLLNENFQPELIFLDINMPKINGWELLEQFNKMNKNYHPRIIVLTTSMNPSDKKKAAGLLKIDYFATKPLTAEKLETIIAHCFSPA
ncbi:MAG: response regulator [Bacteroidota bacterium]